MFYPTFWKLSQGAKLFSFAEMAKSLEEKRVFMHRDTRPMGNSGVSQAEHFIKAK